MKAIVIYYSWGGNTKSIAEKIARELNCGTARIDTEEKSRYIKNGTN